MTKETLDESVKKAQALLERLLTTEERANIEKDLNDGLFNDVIAQKYNKPYQLVWLIWSLMGKPVKRFP